MKSNSAKRWAMPVLSERAFQAQLRQEREAFEQRLIEMRAETEDGEEALAETRTELGQVRAELETARGRIAALEEELRKAYKQVSIRTAEMDALRQAAVSQVAAANVHAGELEQRVRLLETALEAAGGTGRGLEAGAETDEEGIEAAASALRHLRLPPKPGTGLKAAGAGRDGRDSF